MEDSKTNSSHLVNNENAIGTIIFFLHIAFQNVMEGGHVYNQVSSFIFMQMRITCKYMKHILKVTNAKVSFFKFQ